RGPGLFLKCAHFPLGPATPAGTGGAGARNLRNGPRKGTCRVAASVGGLGWTRCVAATVSTVAARVANAGADLYHRQPVGSGVHAHGTCGIAPAGYFCAPF